jgi:RNA polymerase sigma-70 factor, ECF subfamily
MAMSGAAGRSAGEARPADDVLHFRAFHAEHFDLVWRVLTRFGAPPDELEDLVQDVFVIVHRKLPTFRREARVSTWLFAICRKVAAGARRKALVRRVVLDVLGLERRRNVSPEPGVHHDLARAVSRLSEVKRVTLLLHDVDGMSPSEIATLFGCPEATVWTRLRLAWKDLESFRRSETRP